MTEDKKKLPRRAYLGFEVLAEAKDDAHAGVGDPDRERWIVSEIDEGSPADLSGLSLGDDVFALDGLELRSLADLRQRSAAHKSGDNVRLLVQRGQSDVELVMSPQEMPLEPFVNAKVELDEVTWCHEGETHRLRAIWTSPTKRAPWAAVWLLPSATWLSQETPLSTSDPSYHLVEQLTQAGVATLRVDRSGLGDSEGPPCTELDFDAEMSMWNEARSHFLDLHRSNSLPCFLYGRSLGGMLAPLLAKGHDFSGVAVWGTSSESWHQASLASFARQLKRKGVQGDSFHREFQAIESLLALVYDKKLTPKQARSRAPLLEKVVNGEFSGDMIHQRVASFFQQLSDADVAAAWQALEIPVLAVHAEYDILTQKEENEAIIGLAGDNAEFLQLKGIDHFMHQRQSMSDAIDEPWGGPFSPRAADALLDFFRRAAFSKS